MAISPRKDLAPTANIAGIYCSNHGSGSAFGQKVTSPLQTIVRCLAHDSFSTKHRPVRKFTILAFYCAYSEELSRRHNRKIQFVYHDYDCYGR
jgi:hypothetical protein